jgi:uncharacterized membrane protein
MMVVPRRELVELPMSVEEAMRLLVSGGVLNADAGPPALPAGLKELVFSARPQARSEAATGRATSPAGPQPPT